MKEVKFRAWDKQKNKYIQDVGLFPYPWNERTKTQILTISGDGITVNPFHEYIIVEQYTGLKDLYEGDICKTREGLSKIVWFNYAFYLEGIDWEDIILLSNRNVEVKKVGNIHEEAKA